MEMDRSYPIKGLTKKQIELLTEPIDSVMADSIMDEISDGLLDECNSLGLINRILLTVLEDDVRIVNDDKRLFLIIEDDEFNGSYDMDDDEDDILAAYSKL